MPITLNPGTRKILDRAFDVAALVALGLVVARFLLPRPSEPVADLAARAIVPPGQVEFIELGQTYCPACVAMKPVVFALQRVYGDRVRIRVLDLDRLEQRSEAAPLAEAVRLHVTPTLLVTDRAGRVRAKWVGATSYAAIAQALDQALASR